MVYRCEITRPHDFHWVVVKQVETCLGETPCGESVHAPHDIEFEGKEWCGGICGCRLAGEVHGPGDHK